MIPLALFEVTGELAAAGLRVFPPRPITPHPVVFVCEPAFGGPLPLRFDAAAGLRSWRWPTGERGCAATGDVAGLILSRLAVNHVAG
ncbi:hypothetical protein [Mycobacteroides abscessus]|uniref:hypothetical protein n=1 Tax=Mycobacteroides abscessus TaxID=36809 RepID=UPI00078E8556|nr:hypothetical protein [Mycobacteroides abscessus]AMU64504.1 hypothetical protein A3O04_03835 [Mycobacteroides abscessus]MBE5406080.1 hypothetical protein [Mycobacteroides abscessus]MBE5429206.1 hypothetical protein [Mycobacteroides abscessus]MBE5498252.1 hypothetical protein [Mycobacteroides abscessus]MBN7424568.1 hypothetical protein [Mycobacteroides abscessus subsp. massiliense]